MTFGSRPTIQTHAPRDCGQPLTPCTLISGERTQIASQDVSDTFQTPELDANGDIDRPRAIPGPLEVQMNPTLSSPAADNRSSSSQTVAHGSELFNPSEVDRNFNNREFGGFPDARVMPIPTSPPRHTRPLYHSIELPALDDEEPQFRPEKITLSSAGSPISAIDPSASAGTTKLSPPANEPAVVEFPLQVNALGLYTDSPHLHDVVRRALFDTSFSLHRLDPSIGEQFLDPAAGFDVRRLSILFLESGTTINVEPSMRHGGVVCVGDVLRALKAASAGGDAKNGTRVGVIIKGYY